VKCYIGIDLGSTTTKAVVLDEEGDILGRGITNSRSNYDVACEVARTEALLDARFKLFERSVASEEQLREHVAPFTDALRRNFQREQHLYQLGELEQLCRMHAEKTSSSDGAAKALNGIFNALRTEAEELFGPGRKPRSDFFRDIAGSRYMALAEWWARKAEVSYETLYGLFDKSIIRVEASPPATGLQESMGLSLERTLGELNTEQELADRLRRGVQGVIEDSLTAVRTVGTGYGRARLPFPKDCISSEILCHGMGAHASFPGTRTVLDIGGQDTKAIQVDEHGVVDRFQMNDRCAAGCGRYLGYIADEMNVGLHELGPMAMKAKRPVRINSTCTVFAGAELRDRLAAGQRREDILAGLHRAIMLRAMSLLARSGGVFEQFTFTGGVAKNEAAVSALVELVEENYGQRTMNISAESIYTGALGAAIFSRREALGQATPQAQVAGGAA
jgi:benzoyl-CoA reductase subunit A